MGHKQATVGVCAVLAVSLLSVACGSEANKSSDNPIRINELQSSNTVFTDPADGKAPDWIELYNLSDEPVDLAGYFLTDDSAALNKFTFTTDAVIAGGGVLQLWADGADQVSQGPLHVGFKLSATDGDRIILLDSDSFIVDQVEFSAPPAQDQSYARFPDGTGDFAWCSAATFNALNGNACAK
jgi:hypothetical protein